jgi:uncharacterized protein YcfJ
VLALASSAAFAAHRGVTEYVYARVVDVDPIVRYVTVERPRQQCWEDTVYQPDRPLRVAGTTLAGGIVGGAIGRQFGDGRGRDALTLIGSLAGAAVANQRAIRRNGYVAVPVERCELVSERFTEERVDGYRVTYQYQGQRHTMRTTTPPGDRIRLRVDVVPVGY